MGDPAISVTRSYEREEDLAAALSAGEQAAWQQLFHEHHRRIYHYAYMRSGDASDADDIASTVFVEAVKNIHKFEYRGFPVSAWLFRIARNETADLLKRRKKTASQSLSLSNEVVARSLQARDALGPGDDMRDVTKALRRLKDEYRDVILMRFVHGLSIAEVAAIVDKSEGAVKVTQTRALRALRSGLDG